MDDRHLNRTLYFKEQDITTEKYVIPFIQEVKNIENHTSILEIGCGEGGNLAPFLRMGCKRIVGVDLSKGKIENAIDFFGIMENNENIEFIHEDIFNISTEVIGQFDIIIVRDVLEHIHGQDKFMNSAKRYMKPDGVLFMGFPPWYNPFGGHQQMCENKFLSKLPYIHLFPVFLYRFILKLFGESKPKVDGLIDVKQTGISIERFERILKNNSYKIDKRTFYFINPNYEIKFGLKPRKCWRLISSIPFFRNFFITTSYYLVSDNETMRINKAAQ